MTKAEAIKLLQSIPDGELLFIVRGSHPAAPEAVREFARRVLHTARFSGKVMQAGKDITAQLRDEARQIADDTFAVAERMESALRKGGLERMAGEHVIGLPDVFPDGTETAPRLEDGTAPRLVTTDEPSDASPNRRAVKQVAKKAAKTRRVR